jgi:hypothetical protein
MENAIPEHNVTVKGSISAGNICLSGKEALITAACSKYMAY